MSDKEKYVNTNLVESKDKIKPIKKKNWFLRNWYKILFILIFIILDLLSIYSCSVAHEYQKFLNDNTNVLVKKESRNDNSVAYSTNTLIEDLGYVICTKLNDDYYYYSNLSQDTLGSNFPTDKFNDDLSLYMLGDRFSNNLYIHIDNSYQFNSNEYFYSFYVFDFDNVLNTPYSYVFTTSDYLFDFEYISRYEDYNDGFLLGFTNLYFFESSTRGQYNELFTIDYTFVDTPYLYQYQSSSDVESSFSLTSSNNSLYINTYFNFFNTGDYSQFDGVGLSYNDIFQLGADSRNSQITQLEIDKQGLQDELAQYDGLTYEQIYNLGVQEGVSSVQEGDLNNLFKTTAMIIFNSPYNVLHNVFNFSFLGVNLFSLFSFLITCSIVLYILKLIF